MTTQPIPRTQTAVTGKALDRRQAGYLGEWTDLECTRIQSGDITIWVRLNERRPSMTEGSSAYRLGSRRSRCGMQMLEVTCQPIEHIRDAIYIVRRLAKSETPITTNTRWTPRTAQRLKWSPARNPTKITPFEI